MRTTSRASPPRPSRGRLRTIVVTLEYPVDGCSTSSTTISVPRCAVSHRPSRVAKSTGSISGPIGSAGGGWRAGASGRDRTASSRGRRSDPRLRDAPRAPETRRMASEDGPIVAADEAFTHQIVETHARVAQADRSWTEKVCAMAGARDGSLSLGFGLGKYTNRNVLDGYAGVSRGVEQWTVRASRRLSDDPDRTGSGPLHYDVL